VPWRSRVRDHAQAVLEFAVMTSRVIVGVRILDGTGREPFTGSVRVVGNRIAEVSRCAGHGDLHRSPDRPLEAAAS